MTKMHAQNRILAVVLAIVLLFLWSPVTTHAATYTGSGILSNNIHDHVYETSGKVSNSYLVNNGNGVLTRIENFGDVLLIENYNTSFKMTGQGTIPFELSIFGGLYAGANFNYILFGQNNPTKSPYQEVVRIVRYNKFWQRIDSCSVYGGNTVTPFYGANTSISEWGNQLYIRMGHIDGAYVQGTMNLTYDNLTGTILEQQTGKGALGTGAVAGAKANYVDVSTGTYMSCDDLSSQGVISMNLSKKGSGVGVYPGTFYNATALGNPSAAPALSLGGFVTNSQYAIAVGTTSTVGASSTARNVFVMVTPRNAFQSSSTQTKFLTGHAFDERTATTPYIVNLGNQYMVLWEEKQAYADLQKVYYAVLDIKGDRIGDVKSIDGCLSDCQPVVFGNQIVWYTTNGASMKFYGISVSGATTTTGITNAPTTVLNGVDYSAVYDYNYYISTYPDVRVLYTGKPVEALQHFVAIGMPSGRQGCENFNFVNYYNRYPDLQMIYGMNVVAYYHHFMLYGAAEGRNGR